MSEHDTPMDAPDQYAAYPDYPEIDETMQYPWAGAAQQSDHRDQSSHEDVPQSLIDPRLYGGELAPPMPAEPLPAGPSRTQQYSPSEFSDESEYQDNGDHDSGDDSEFVNESDEYAIFCDLKSPSRSNRD